MGIPLHPAGCIIIGTIFLENMPREQLLALRVQCFKSHRNFGSKLQCFFGVSEASFIYINSVTGYALTPIEIHPSPLIINCLFFYKPSCAFEFRMLFIFLTVQPQFCFEVLFNYLNLLFHTDLCCCNNAVLKTDNHKTKQAA